MRAKNLNPTVSDIITAWAELTIKEQDILTSRYSQGKTQKELSIRYSVTPERIRQIEEEAYIKLTKALK